MGVCAVYFTCRAIGSANSRLYRDLSIVRSKTNELLLLGPRHLRRATDELELWYYADCV